MADDTLQPSQATLCNTDDIVTRMRKTAEWCNHGYPNGLGDSYPAPTSCGNCKIWIEAADEIERLREQLQDARMHLEQDACEIERLYAEINELRIQVVKLSLPQELRRG